MRGRMKPKQSNDDVAPTLTVFKSVINNSGGTAAASEFTMIVAATEPSLASFPGDSGGTTITMDAGNYAVAETGPSGYAQIQLGECSGVIAG